MLRHVVMLEYKEETSEEQKATIAAAFVALKGKIDAIKALEWGVQATVENLNEGLEHTFIVTFEDAAGRALYLPHPDHLAFGELLTPHLKRVVVSDFFITK